MQSGNSLLLIAALIAAPTLLGTRVPAVSSIEMQENKSDDIDGARSDLLKRWGSDGIVKPSEVDADALALLKRPLAEQSDAQLQELARRANVAANFVGFLLEEYESYYKENYRYDFVQQRVAPYHDAYVKSSNRLKAYRNQCYFNMGKKAAERGDNTTAFLMFRDSYRLSSFVEEQGDHKGMRYQAEIEMKRLLGLENTDTFTYWK